MNRDLFEAEEQIFRSMKFLPELREKVYSRALHGNAAARRLCLRWEKQQERYSVALEDLL